jgi:3-oxoacyl-(acyl-carrier-protein) synthase
MSDAALGPNDIDLVSAHATATPHNDRAETRAIIQILGTAATRVVVHPFKAASVVPVGTALLEATDGDSPSSIGTGALPQATAKSPARATIAANEVRGVTRMISSRRGTSPCPGWPRHA